MPVRAFWKARDGRVGLAKVYQAAFSARPNEGASPTSTGESWSNRSSLYVFPSSIWVNHRKNYLFPSSIYVFHPRYTYFFLRDI